MSRLRVDELTFNEEMENKEFIFGAVHVLANKIQVVADRSSGDITLKQWFVLIMIFQFKEEAPTLSELSELMGSSRQNVKQIVLKLEAKGYIKIEKDHKDARILRLYLTSDCKKYFEEQEMYGNHFLEMLYKDLNHEEIRQIAIGMAKLVENITKMDELTRGGYQI